MWIQRNLISRWQQEIISLHIDFKGNYSLQSTSEPYTWEFRPYLYLLKNMVISKHIYYILIFNYGNTQNTNKQTMSNINKKTYNYTRIYKTVTAVLLAF